MTNWDWEGVLRSIGQGVMVHCSLKPLSIFKGHFGRKSKDFFSWNEGSFLKKGPMFKDIFAGNVTHVKVFFSFVKSNPLERHIPISLINYVSTPWDCDPTNVDLERI